MARIPLLWVQELPANQAGQEEAVNGHRDHLGKGRGMQSETDLSSKLAFLAILPQIPLQPLQTTAGCRGALQGCSLCGLSKTVFQKAKLGASLDGHCPNPPPSQQEGVFLLQPFLNALHPLQIISLFPQ